MNWATITPESRLYKGKALYRWDVSPGLEHHCGICSTPLHNARAKTSCLGKHVEPCYRFHQQLHFVGKSHECFGCNSSDEMHHNRHKDVLKIVRQISIFDQGNSATPIAKTIGGGKARRGSVATSITTPTDTSSETFAVEGTKMTRRERKKAKKTGNWGITKEKHSLDVFSREEVDFISEAIHLTVHESKGAWEGTYIYDSRQPENEQVLADDADTEDIMEDLDALSVKSLAMMTPRQRRTVKKFSAPVGHSSFRGGSRRFLPHPVSIVDPCDGVDPRIFFRLGIEVSNSPQNCKAGKDLVAKLVAAVKEDLEIIEREEAESAMREEGFWRWAGKTAYHTMKRTREELDWATGQKKGAPRRQSFADVGEDMGHLADIIEQHVESLSPIINRNGMTFAERIAPPKVKLESKVKPEAKVKIIEGKTNSAESIPLIHQGEDEDDEGGWSVVKRSKGNATKQTNWEAPQAVYRRARDNLTISLK